MSLHSHAQFYDMGQDPASLKWRQINTPDFQVVFPEGFEKEANRLANVLDTVHGSVSKSLRHKPKKITVILHNHSTYSNGMVAWAPKLMDLYPTPPQENYAMDWIDQLAIHETRHVVQMDKLNQGITRVGYYFFGQQAVGAVSGLMPRWFFEGDAVNTETALSSTGRGRMASFGMEMKALVSRDSLYSYEKILRGSFRDYVPDAYHIGYPIVAWTRKKFGPLVFSNAVDEVAKKPFTLFPFPVSIKKQTGLPLRKLYKATYLDLKRQWSSEMVGNSGKLHLWNKGNKRSYTNYEFPKYVDDSTLIAVKSGMDQLTEFVLVLKDGTEKMIHRPGYYVRDQFSYAAGKYCWAEQISDARWSNRTYNCIKTGNLKTGKIKMLTHKTRYFAPELSPDASRMAAVEVSLQNEYFIVILDSGSGKLLNRIPAPEGRFLRLPSWLKDGNGIVAITTGKDGNRIDILNLKTGNWTKLTGATYRNLKYPGDAGDVIMYVSDANGTDNIYAVSKTENTISRITDAKFGVTTPEISPNGQILFFSEYSSQGFDIVSKDAVQKIHPAVTDIKDPVFRLAEASSEQENFNFQKNGLAEKQYEIRNYSKAGHLLNIHSWAPFYYNYNNLDVYSLSPGISLLSQDKLGTLSSSIGYAYANGYSYLKVDFTYKGIYPLIDFSLTYGGKIPVSAVNGAPAPAVTGSGLGLSSRVYLPLDFTRGVTIKGFTPSIRWQYENEVFYNRNTNAYSRGNSLVTYGFEAFAYRRRSLRDLAPRFGTVVSSAYTYAPFANNLFSKIWYVHARIYLPGLLKHHSLQLSAGYQEQLPSFYMFSSSYLSFPRGYTTGSPNSIQLFTSNYAFPLIYPDLALGPVLYIKRIRANLFYDYATVGNTYRSQNSIFRRYTNLSSTGADFLADFHLLRILFPLQAGVRVIYLPDTKQYSSQLLFNIDISNF